MATAPDCSSMGPQCLALAVRLQVARAEDSGPHSVDHEATWLMGHTDRIDFGAPGWEGLDLVVPATLRVPCRFLTKAGSQLNCRAHGYTGEVASETLARAERQLGDGWYDLVEAGRITPTRVEIAPPEGLPVLSGPNPCATARCSTADHKTGAACCRDLQIEILCNSAERHLESLVRARKSPYLCKVTRETPESLGAEMISACSFLEHGGVVCTLHGKRRPDGRSAKPDLCFDWPTPKDNHHPGCAFIPQGVSQ